MNTQAKSTTLRRLFRTGLMAASLAAVVGGATMAPAHADEYRHDYRYHDRFAREHWRAHERWEHRHFVYAAPRDYRYAAPGYAYAPAPVYSAPALSVFVPLHIR